MSVCETNCKLYKKLRDLVVITDDGMCSKKCFFIHPHFAFCGLFNDVVPYMDRCNSCKEIFDTDRKIYREMPQDNLKIDMKD